MEFLASHWLFFVVLTIILYGGATFVGLSNFKKMSRTLDSSFNKDSLLNRQSSDFFKSFFKTYFFAMILTLMASLSALLGIVGIIAALIAYSQ